MRRHLLTIGLTLLIVPAVRAQTDSAGVLHLNPGDVASAQIDIMNGAGPVLLLYYGPDKQAEFTRIVGDNVTGAFPVELNGVPAGQAHFYARKVGDFLNLQMPTPAAAVRAADLVLNPKPPKLDQIEGGPELDLALDDAQAGFLKIFPDHVSVSLDSVSQTQCAAWEQFYKDNLGKPINIRICGKVVSHVLYTQDPHMGWVEFPVATPEDGLADMEYVVPPYKPGEYTDQ